MSKKVLLVLVDGMRPDSLEACKHPYIGKMIQDGSYTGQAQTVMPSVTLPCHMSLFHSVKPDRHGVLTNVYTPQVRPINGLCEQLKLSNKSSGLFYNWEELRDLARPGSISCGCFISGKTYTYRESNIILTDKAIKYINKAEPDFVFLYLGHVDEAGHAYGWMSEEYIQSVYDSWNCIERITSSISDDYIVMVTSDHGGHDRLHGTEMPEDMTIPLFISGKSVTPGLELKDVNIIDIAPTVVKLLGAEAAAEWEGKSLL